MEIADALYGVTHARRRRDDGRLAAHCATSPTSRLTPGLRVGVRRRCDAAAVGRVRSTAVRSGVESCTAGYLRPIGPMRHSCAHGCSWSSSMLVVTVLGVAVVGVVAVPAHRRRPGPAHRQGRRGRALGHVSGAGDPRPDARRARTSRERRPPARHLAAATGHYRWPTPRPRLPRGRDRRRGSRRPRRPRQRGWMARRGSLLWIIRHHRRRHPRRRGRRTASASCAAAAAPHEREAPPTAPAGCPASDLDRRPPRDSTDTGRSADAGAADAHRRRSSRRRRAAAPSRRRRPSSGRSPPAGRLAAAAGAARPVQQRPR